MINRLDAWTQKNWPLVVVAVFTISFVVGACASRSAKHTATVADTALFETLNDIHGLEQTALCGQPSCANVTTTQSTPGWTLEKSQGFNQKLLPAITAGREFNRVLGTWQPGTPMPPSVHVLIQSIGESLTAVASDFPDGTTKATLLARIGKAQTIVLGALDLVLAAR